MEPVSITALIVSIGSIVCYLIRKKLKKSSCTSTSESSSCTSSMQFDLNTKNELYQEISNMKTDIASNISKLQTEIEKLQNDKN